MVNCPKLKGRLGNHLFQIAATISLAVKNGDKPAFPKWKHRRDFSICRDWFFDDLDSFGPKYEEPRFCFDEIPYAPNLQISGYFQSERYFAQNQELIKACLTPKAYKGGWNEKIASLHVRRGCYLLMPEFHPVLSKNYYIEAVKYLQQVGVKKFLVFSDDLPWCRENFTESIYEVIPDMSPIDQFIGTMNCEHHIMANSTFSWWSAWLSSNPKKIVIGPKLWFGPEYIRHDTKDLIPEQWIKI